MVILQTRAEMYADDIKQLREAIPQFTRFTDDEVATFYNHYSEYTYCAGWMLMTDGVIEDFKEWLLTAPILKEE